MKFCVAFHYKPQHVTHILHHLSSNGAHCSLVVLQLDLNALCPPGELTHGKLGSVVTAEGNMTHARAVWCEGGTGHTTLLAAARQGSHRSSKPIAEARCSVEGKRCCICSLPHVCTVPKQLLMSEKKQNAAWEPVCSGREGSGLC